MFPYYLLLCNLQAFTDSQSAVCSRPASANQSSAFLLAVETPRSPRPAVAASHSVLPTAQGEPVSNVKGKGKGKGRQFV